MDEVREVRADLAAPAADLVAGRALGLLAVEDGPASGPVAALQLGDLPLARIVPPRFSSVAHGSRNAPQGNARGVESSRVVHETSRAARPPVARAISTGSGSPLLRRDRDADGVASSSSAGG